MCVFELIRVKGQILNKLVHFSPSRDPLISFKLGSNVPLASLSVWLKFYCGPSMGLGFQERCSCQVYKFLYTKKF